jgi:hypothetical protein
VRATDTAGFSTTAQQIIVNVSANPPPVVSVTSPQNSATFVVNQSVPWAASASASGANIAKVEFYAGAALVGTATVAPYAGNWTPAAAGSYVLTAKATDSQGASTVSAPVNVVVSASPPPTVSLVTPAAGAVYATPGTVTFTASAAPVAGGAPIAQVAYYVAGNYIGSSTTAPYTLVWPAPASGTYAVTAVATDAAGMQATSATVNMTVVQSPPPTVALRSPAAGTSYAAPASITLTASAAAVASGASITKVDFYQGNVLLGTATAAPYLYTWSGVPAGNYSLAAIATDSVGVQASSPSTTVTVGNVSVAFTSPPDGAALSGFTTLVQGTVQAPPNSGVTVNGVLAMVDGANKFYAQVPLQAGSNAVTVTVTASTGQAITKSIAVTSDGVPPFLSIDVSATEGVSPLTVTYTLTNTGTTDATVLVNGGSQFTVPAGQTVPLTSNFTGIGAIFRTISATNGAGGSMSWTFAVLLDDPAQLDQRLKAVWNGMNTALIVGDKATAMNYLSTGAQAIYGPVFDKLMPFMSDIVASFSTPQMGTVSSDLSEYAVTRSIDGVNNVFFLYFTKDGNGVWRLDSM